MKREQTSVCCALAMAFSMLLNSSGANAATASPDCSGNIVEAIPETSFSTSSSINLFTLIVSNAYQPKQIALKSGNGVADFAASPGFLEDQPPWYFTPNSSQIAADGGTSYTKPIPFAKPFHVRFMSQIVSPSGQPIFNPFGGIVFELHDTDPVFAQYGDPSHSAVTLNSYNGNYTFVVNGTTLWTAPYTIKTWDTFELRGVLQKNPVTTNPPSTTTTANYGWLELKRNGVVVATSSGPNSDSMTPTYPVVPGTPPTPLGPPPHPLTSGPHVRLGLGRVPSASAPGAPTTLSEVYVDNVHAVYRDK